MNSVYYSQNWKKWWNCSDDYSYAVDRLPVLSKLFKDLKTFQMHFTIVDTNYSLLNSFLNKKAYHKKVFIEHCPEEVKKKLLNEGFSLKKWGTIIIDLQKTEEELWSTIKKETRKIIRKTSNAGCRAELCKSEKEFREYYELLKKSKKHMHFKTEPYAIAQRQWTIMHPENYHVFFVRGPENDLLAAMGVFYTKDYMIEVAAARSEESKYRHLYANDLLKWEIIRWGKQQGIKYYDLAGVNPNPREGSKEENIKKFKEKFGGQYYTWDFFEKYSTHTAAYKTIHKLEMFHRGKHEKEQE